MKIQEWRLIQIRRDAQSATWDQRAFADGVIALVDEVRANRSRAELEPIVTEPPPPLEKTILLGHNRPAVRSEVSPPKGEAE